MKIAHIGVDRGRLVEELGIVVQDSRSSFGTKDEVMGTRHHNVGKKQVGASAAGTSTRRGLGHR
jgi:hypothetical protein